MREEKSRKIKKPDFFLRLTALQITLCLIIAGIVFLAAKLDADFYNSLKVGFAELMNKDFDFSGVNPFENDTKATDSSTTDNAEKDENSSREAGSETSSENPSDETSTELSAGGADITDEKEMKNVSFAFYEAGDAAMPVNGKITSDFGERVHPVYGTTGFHAGRDIAAEEGTEIYAALDGTVIEVGVGELSGNYVKLKHSESIVTLYCHCKSINVSEGVNVRKGDVIGFVGQTGLATGPHLHFEVQINGVKSDPAYLLDTAQSVY